MKNLTACPWSGWPIVCLLLCFPFFSKAQCPAYPRAMDQVYICYSADHLLSFDQNATLHNPVRFTFPGFPSDVTVTFNAGDGNGQNIIDSEEIRTVSYAAPGQYQLYWTVSWVSGYEDDSRR